MKENKKYILIVILGIVIVAVLGSLFVNLGMEWFNSLVKPSQWIPNIIIPIMWTIIYLSFGIVLTLWLLKSDIPLSVVILLIINGLLNVLWCLFFFTLHLTFVGNIVIIINLIAGVALFLKMYKYEKIFALVTIIYPIWLSLATSLNLALWILN